MTAPLATFSSCGRYRYTLRRDLGPPEFPGFTLPGSVCWIMLNPSTADAERNDPTVTRCINFTRAWGYRELVVVNLFAWRSKAPKALRTAVWPVSAPVVVATEFGVEPETHGGANDDAIVCAVASAALVVAAWGRNGSLQGRGHRVADAVRSDLAATGRRSLLRVLGNAISGAPYLCQNGEPGHPLYLPKTSIAVPW